MEKINMREIKNDLLRDSYFEINHKSGLKILVYPKSGYSSTYAIFGTNYGSIDTFIKKRGENAEPIPEGTAHFLEHKLFESEDGDAFTKYAETAKTAERAKRKSSKKNRTPTRKRQTHIWIKYKNEVQKSLVFVIQNNNASSKQRKHLILCLFTEFCKFITE